MELAALFCTRTLRAVGLGCLAEVVGQSRGEKGLEFPIFSCNSFHKFVHSECIINKQ